MPRLHRRFALGFAPALGLALGVLAQPASPPPSLLAAAASPAPVELAPAAAPVKTWRTFNLVSSSIGWRDNVLLSPFAPIPRLFARGELEVLARGRRDQCELIAFLSGDVLRYFSPPPETRGEQLWLAELEGRWQPKDRVRFALRGVGYQQDTVLDLSESAATRVVVPARVRGGYVTGLTQLTLPGGFRLEPSVQAKRTNYRDIPGDYREEKSGARLAWSRSAALALSADWSEQHRHYLQRNHYPADGRALAGTLLQFRQRAIEAKATSAWEAARGKWTAGTTLARLENRDGTSGFFDYDQQRAHLSLGWERQAWRATLEGDAKRADYLVQSVGAGLTPPPRVADGFELSARLERDLSVHWIGFAEYRWERNRSNQTEFDYRAISVLAGVQRNF